MNSPEQHRVDIAKAIDIAEGLLAEERNEEALELLTRINAALEEAVRPPHIVLPATLKSW